MLLASTKYCSFIVLINAHLVFIVDCMCFTMKCMWYIHTFKCLIHDLNKAIITILVVSRPHVQQKQHVNRGGREVIIDCLLC